MPSKTDIFNDPQPPHDFSELDILADFLFTVAVPASSSEEIQTNDFCRRINLCNGKQVY
jgi:hypothetical protein